MRTHVIATLFVVLALFTGACAGRQAYTRTVPAPAAELTAPEPVPVEAIPAATDPSTLAVEDATAAPADPAPVAKVVPAEPETTTPQATDDGASAPTIDETADRAAEARKDFVATVDRYDVLIAEMEAEEKAAREQMAALRKQRDRTRAAAAALAEADVAKSDGMPAAGFLDAALTASSRFAPPQGGVPTDSYATGPARDQAASASTDEIAGSAGARSSDIRGAGSMTPTEAIFLGHLLILMAGIAVGLIGGILLSRKRPAWSTRDEEPLPLEARRALAASAAADELAERASLIAGLSEPVMLVTELVSGKPVGAFLHPVPGHPSIDAPNDPEIPSQALANDKPSIGMDDAALVADLNNDWFFQPPADETALVTSAPKVLRLASGTGPMSTVEPPVVALSDGTPHHIHEPTLDEIEALPPLFGPPTGPPASA